VMGVAIPQSGVLTTSVIPVEVQRDTLIVPL
jgi:hypothetical protein